MSYLHEPIISRAYYRSTDPITNLKVKIELERITSSIHFTEPKFNNKENVDDKLNSNIKDKVECVTNLVGKNNVEVHTFKWQEKVFSEEEYQFYLIESNCDTVLQCKYHKECHQLQEDKGRTSRCLFTYVSNDSFTNNDSVVKVTTETAEKETELAEKMRGIRHRRVAPASKTLTSALNENKYRLLSSDIVNYDPTDEQRKTIHLMSLNTQNMYIMAEIRDINDLGSREQVILCEINVDENGIVSIKPDFNDGKKPYPVHLRSCRDLYQYTIEHASDNITKEELDVEQKMYSELYSRHATYLSECVGREFYIPPPNVLNYFIFGEIHSAINFEYDDVYVTYYIDLPEGWFARDINCLQGVTQACTAKSVNRDNVSHFCFPFEAELEYDENFLENNPDSGDVIGYPEFFVEVRSLDGWGRCRLEGYGYVILPNKAGRSVEDVNCWRPGNDYKSNLRRFFIGGNPVLEDAITCAKPHYFKDKYLSKLGTKTESTGSVKLKFNIVKQSRKFIGTSTQRIGNTSDVTFDKFSDLSININDAMGAFQAAKQRMICARKNLHTEYFNTINILEIGKTD